MQEFERASFHKEMVDEENYTGSYVFEPLERGFGTTIGNTLCKIMISNLPGTGVIGFSCDNFNENRTIVNGILEDVNGIILNLKKIQLNCSEDGVKKLHISKKGPAIIQTADLICPECVNIVDPDQFICSLEKGASLEMDVYIATLTGYKSSLENKDLFGLGEDVIAMDTMFTPVRKADYLSEPARIGLDTKYDKVHFYVTTNGSITPLQAISQAAEICVENLDQIVPLAGLKLEESFMIQQPRVEDTKKTNTILIEDLDLSVISYNCLKRAGIQTVDELTQKTEDEMMHVKNLGKKSLKEVKDKMYQLGLFFKSFE